MILSQNWLNDYVDTKNIPIGELCEALTMSGSKVEKYRDLSEPLAKIVFGKVLEIKKHENSDKLYICQVDTGSGSPLQIVTGAGNVYAGAVVPVVLDGGVVFNRQDGTSLKIKKGKLRGEVSDGMLCSPDELGLDKNDFPYADLDGILIFNDDPDADKIAIGESVFNFIGLDDKAIEFEITNNRPDCLSVLGLARETAATFNLPLELKEPAYKGYNCDIEKEIDVVIENKRLCSRYMAGLARNVKIGPSPRWLSARLRACGVRPLNNIVDITNYVMLEYGHPMHAFDKRFIEGDGIIVRNALPDEKITLLDGNTIALDREMLVIADRMKPIAVAGVMGGEYSGVMPDTETVVFESACFDGLSVRRASQKAGRRTESSSRFEKGLDPVNAKAALLRALQLVELIGCGEPADTFIDYVNFTDNPKSVKHDYKAVNALLGTDIPEKEQIVIFKRLGFAYEDGFVTPPRTRSDIQQTCDLAEEVARIYGYNNIVPTLPRLRNTAKPSEYERNTRKLTYALLGQGCRECVTYSFASSEMNKFAGKIAANGSPVKIRNPFGEETSEMRVSLVPSMLRVIAGNLNARNTEARFFENGRCYLNDEQGVTAEWDALCIGLYGKDESFYTLKGVVEEILSGLGVEAEIERYAEKPYHPGRAAVIKAKGGIVTGRFGEISPLALQELDISERVYIAEISLEALFAAAEKTAVYKSVPRYPAVTRDISLVCADEIPSGDILALIRQKGGKLLENAEFFDLFKGGSLKAGEKSLSYKLTFRKEDGTLTDKETDGIIDRILAALKENNITLRT